jgi:hypothetical protein
MENLTESEIEFLAWRSVLDRLDEGRRERLTQLLKSQFARPITVQQHIVRLERALSADYSKVSTAQHIDALEASLEEAISTLKNLANQQAAVPGPKRPG